MRRMQLLADGVEMRTRKSERAPQWRVDEEPAHRGALQFAALAHETSEDCSVMALGQLVGRKHAALGLVIVKASPRAAGRSASNEPRRVKRLRGHSSAPLQSAGIDLPHDALHGRLEHGAKRFRR